MPRHAVHRPARERRRAADVEAAHRRAVGRQRGHGTEDDLVERVAATADIAAEEVGVASCSSPGPST